MIGVKSEIRGSDLNRLRVWDKASTRKSCQVIIRVIKRRNRTAKAADGAAFRPYTPRYVADRRRGNFRPVAKVTLRRTGAMNAAWKVTRADLERGRAAIVNIPYARYVNESRTFAEFSASELRAHLTPVFRDGLAKNLKRVPRRRRSLNG